MCHAPGKQLKWPSELTAINQPFELTTVGHATQQTSVYLSHTINRDNKWTMHFICQVTIHFLTSKKKVTVPPDLSQDSPVWSWKYSPVADTNAMSSLTSTDTEDACPGNMSRSYGGRTNYQYTPAACIIRACTISSSAPTKSNGAINCFPRFLRSMNRRACLFSSRPYTTRRQGHYEQFQRTAITWIFHGELITPRTPSLGHVEIDFPRTATRFPLSLISRIPASL
jgi:hypothetical protein